MSVKIYYRIERSYVPKDPLSKSKSWRSIIELKETERRASPPPTSREGRSIIELKDLVLIVLIIKISYGRSIIELKVLKWYVFIRFF